MHPPRSAAALFLRSRSALNSITRNETQKISRQAAGRAGRARGKQNSRLPAGALLSDVESFFENLPRRRAVSDEFNEAHKARRRAAMRELKGHPCEAEGRRNDRERTGDEGG